jgi:hypothetical protein
MRGCERLRVPLTKLVGTAGFSALVARSQALATREVPSLKRPRASGALGKSRQDQIQRKVGAGEAGEDGGEIQLAVMLGLLVTFIGESITMILVREAWPDVSIRA